MKRQPDSGRRLALPEWFEGAIDLHVHSHPSIFPRLLSDREVVEHAARAGMRAVVLKAHEGSTVERAAIASEGAKHAAAADSSVGRAPAVRGGIVLNHFVGGMNPVAVEVALALGGAVVWLPTIHAANHMTYYGMSGFAEQRSGYLPRPVQPISVVNEGGELTLEAHEVLEVVAAHPGAVLNNGHLGATETAALFREAKRLGVEQLLIAHPELPLTGYSLDFQLAMAQLGAKIERCYLPHTELWGGFPIEQTAREIERIGPQHCVLSTDLGQATGLAPVDGLARFGAALIENGLTTAAVEMMIKTNPATLLGLE